MKKVLIATIEFPPQKGGIANYLAGLVEALPRGEIVVLAPHHRSTADFDSHKEYKIYRKNLITKLPLVWPKWLPMVWHLWRVARREKVDVILVGQVLPVGTAAFLVKKIFGIPYFVSCHGMDILIPQKSPRKKKLLKKNLEQADGIIANSQFTKNELIKIGILENKISIIYPCPVKAMITVPSKVEKVRKKYSLENKKVILTVGRLVERKGHDKVIEAMAKILERVPNAMYVIVGNGPEKEKLQVLSYKLRVKDKVIFAGEISDNELVAFYELCDVFIMVPRQIGGDVEGFGTVFLEANQFGKPVVASKSGGVAEAVVDGITGLLVDGENTDQIAEAAVKLLFDNSLAKKLGEQGRKRVEKEFQWEIQVGKLNKLLE